MATQYGFSIAAVKEIFLEEVLSAGGRMNECHEDHSRLFMRSVLPATALIRSNDPVQAGIALKAVEHEVWVHPYVFRKVCCNGAIVAHAVESEHLDGLNYYCDDVARDRVRQAVRGCCGAEAFQVAARQMRSATEREADTLLNLATMLTRFRFDQPNHLAQLILQRLIDVGDTTRFGLLNAVTSAARDTGDPELRWRLEEFGGSILVARFPRQPSGRPTSGVMSIP